jgi:germination protein YpeB
MRRAYWVPVGLLAAVALALWGVWTWRLNVANVSLANTVEADRQRNFNDMAFHVEQIQSLLGKGLVTGTTRQNMRYMGEVYNHAQAAVTNFTSLPLPAEISASVGKFLQQTGDFAVSTMRNEAAGRELDNQGRGELARLRTQSVSLSAQMQDMMARYNQGSFRWSPPVRFGWGALWRGAGVPGKPATGNQAPASLVPGGWDQMGAAMQKLPVMIYDGPFSDHVSQRAPAVTGTPVSRDDAAKRMQTYLPNAGSYRVTEVVDMAGTLPAWSFRLVPANAGAAAAGNAYTTTVEIAKNGGFLVDMLNSRTIGKAAIDLDRARDLGVEYLEAHGFPGMVPTYGQIQDGAATIAYAYRDGGVLIYPDQVKIKVALDNGEILAVDARQYLMSHHPRTLPEPKVTARDAETKLRPELTVDRTQLTLIPSQAGTGEILCYEFLSTFGDETFLVYINALTGEEEQILQQVQTDGGTFAL